MAEWTTMTARDVRKDDRIRHPAGVELTVSRIEPGFMGRSGMLAFVQDTAEGWLKAPSPEDAELEVLRAG